MKTFIQWVEAFSSRDRRQEVGELMQPADRLIRGTRSLLHGVRMTRSERIRPVQAHQAKQNPKEWPLESQQLAQALHQKLAIGNQDWHALKGQPQRRAAEQLVAALVLLLDEENSPGAATVSPQRREATALVEHALGWLTGERKDPGCPTHGH